MFLNFSSLFPPLLCAGVLVLIWLILKFIVSVYPKEARNKQTQNTTALQLETTEKLPPRTKILFLTTVAPSEIKAEWPYYQNWTLPREMQNRGASVSIICWRDKSLNERKLAEFDVITFLWCNNYHYYPIEFPKFIKSKLLPAQNLRPALRVLNDSAIILWNTDKAHYLGELQNAGFVVPKFESVSDCSLFPTVNDLAQHVSMLATRLNNGPVVLKPSISGSSKQTHLVMDPLNLASSDLKFINEVMRDGTDGSLMVQVFEPGITNGEYSLVFIAGKHTHTMVKAPAKGDFRCQAEFGGCIEEIGLDQVPQQARQVAREIMKFLVSRVGNVLYCRVDGVLRDTGEFVLMEIEAIEPHLWLETCDDLSTREALYQALLETQHSGYGNRIP